MQRPVVYPAGNPPALLNVESLSTKIAHPPIIRTVLPETDAARSSGFVQSHTFRSNLLSVRTCSSDGREEMNCPSAGLAVLDLRPSSVELGIWLDPSRNNRLGLDRAGIENLVKLVVRASLHGRNPYLVAVKRIWETPHEGVEPPKHLPFIIPFNFVGSFDDSA